MGGHDEKNPAGLPESVPSSQMLEVPSRKYLSGAAMLPKRVGLPNNKPSQRRRSSSVAYGAPASGTGLTGRSLSALTGGTVRTVAVQPVTAATPRAAWRASSAVAPFRE